MCIGRKFCDVHYLLVVTLSKVLIVVVVHVVLFWNYCLLCSADPTEQKKTACYDIDVEVVSSILPVCAFIPSLTISDSPGRKSCPKLP